MPLKLTPVERLDLIDEVVSLSATAICLRHPQARVLATVSFGSLQAVSNDDLAAEQLRLKAWIAEQEEGEHDAAGA